MENAKRPRLDISRNHCGDGGAVRTFPIGNIGGQSIFIDKGNSTDTVDVSTLPTNIFLTICDENSGECHEYFTFDSSSLAQVKQEHAVLSAQTKTVPLQYSIVNQVQPQQQLHVNGGGTSTLIPAENTQSTTVLPANVQLPTGCEIYLVKEYVEPAITNDNSCTSLVDSNLFSITATRPITTVKTEADTHLCADNDDLNMLRNNFPNKITPAKVSGGSVAVRAVAEQNRKSSFILEAYKKRDDKRRATHNEVERRRRDKINSWIFKLKEMLPTDLSNSTTTASNTKHHCITGVKIMAAGQILSPSNDMQNQQRSANNNCRSPPSDSKSQILIKTCEYIKTMQKEIKSLRECLTENEHLRSSNQRLQNELNKLRSERGNNLVNNNISKNPNNNFTITLNNLNSNGIFCNGTSVGANVNSSIANMPYTKRELIIRDYVD